MPHLQLADEDARIVALAIAYHLGRPGSETDPDTLQRHDRGLASVQRTLDPLIGRAHVEFDVTPYQLHRIDEGLLGVTNELKAYEMANRASVVPGFVDALARLFPDLAPASSQRDIEADEDADTALDLVTRVVGLRRRLAVAVADARAAVEAERAAAARAAAELKRAQRPWWRFWG